MSFYYKTLMKKIAKREATIAVVGLGYVGLPVLIQFYRKGFKCIGLDIEKKKIESFSKYKFDTNFFSTILRNKKKHSVKKLQKINFSTDYSLISNADVIIICLPSPVFKNKKPNLKIIKSSLKQMSKFLKQGQLISLESTVSPGTTNDVFVKTLSRKYKLSENFFLVYSPERENPVIKNLGQRYNFYNTPKICSGYSTRCSKLGFVLYSKVIKKVVKSKSIQSAEMSKMIENVYRATNIGLVNELKMLCHKMNIDIHEVLKLARTKPFGFTPFKPGPGIGGHCIPVDPYYLINEARKQNFNLKFIKQAMNTNKSIIKWSIKKIENIIRKEKINLKNSKILFLGAAYKANIDDIRESPSIKIFKYFNQQKINFDYCDPYISKIKIIDLYKKSINLNYKYFKNYKVVILLTDHNAFNQKQIINNSKLIIDTRGFFQSFKSKKIYSI